MALLLPIVIFSVRMVKNMGIKWFHFIFWVLILGMMGLAGYMEYYVQRHGNEALFAYTMMGTGLIVIVLTTLVIRAVGNRAARKKAAAAVAETV